MQGIKKKLLAMDGVISIREKNEIMKEIADATLQVQKDGDDLYSIILSMETVEFKEKELLMNKKDENKEIAGSLGLDTTGSERSIVNSIITFFNGR